MSIMEHSLSVFEQYNCTLSNGDTLHEQAGMFKNYLKVAFVNLKKHKAFSFINIFGLAIAWPIVYLSLRLWFQGFACRTSLSLSAFFVSAVISIGVAVLTVSYQAIKSAVTDPVETLRYE